MGLRLEIISEHKRILGEDFERSFGPDGGTIGRSLDNDWVFPDTEKFVSGKHATIDYQSGAYYLADVSSNGTYVNGAIEPLGRGNPRRLFDGDQLRMGNFEMRVHLDEGEDLAMPPEPKPTVVPDHIEQLVPVDSMNSSVMLLDEEEITGDKAFSDAFALHPSVAPPPPQEPHPPVLEPEQPSSKPDNAVKADATDSTGLLQVFLTAAGIDPDDLHPSVDATEVMTNAGEVLAELVAGMTDLLVARSNAKSMFRLDQTTVLPRHNNPLKLSESTADSLKQLLVGREGEYLGPLDSVREASRDLRFHHDALIAGMIKAFGEFIDRFDPSELEDAFQNTQERKPMFDALAKRKYWDLYCDLYPIMTQSGTAGLPQQYSEDFVANYEKQLADFKRMERTLGKTQSFDAAKAGHQPTDTVVLEEVMPERNAEPEPTVEFDLDEDDAADEALLG